MRLPRRVFVAVALLIFSAFTTRADAAAPGPLGTLQTELSTMSMHARAMSASWLRISDRPEHFGDANAQMPAASTIKDSRDGRSFQAARARDFTSIVRSRCNRATAIGLGRPLRRPARSRYTVFPAAHADDH